MKARLNWGLFLAVLMGAMSPAWAQQGPIPLLPAPPAAPARVESESLRTTTDTAEYCKHLHGQVDHLLRGTQIATDEKVRNLSEEGERLCQRGLTRSGIQHLRRAYVILSKTDAAR